MSVADDLEKLDQLRGQGVLSEAEFAAAKAALLRDGSLPQSPINTPGPKINGKYFLVGALGVGVLIFAVSKLAGGRSGIDYADMCKSSRVRSLAAHAVEDKVASAGLGVRDLSLEFAKLRIVHDATSEMVERQARQVKDITIDDVQVCAADGDVTAYTTIVFRSGDKVGGEVLNFGIPGAIAKFGELPLGD